MGLNHNAICHFLLLFLPPLSLSLSPQTADANLSFDAQILEAAKSIAAATKSLVQSARATQRELTEQGKVSLGTVPADSQWSDGLVSAVSTCTCNIAVF